MKYLYCALLLLFSCCCIAQESLDSIFLKAKIAGAQLVVVDHNHRQNYYYGIADESVKVDSTTVFQAASLSKAVLAYIVMRMVDRKEMLLDEPLRNYYKYDRINADTAAWPITARMVLHHQTGFPNWAANPVSKQWFTSSLKTNFTPGSSWSYSGEGFMYLQYAVESIWKQSLEKIARQEVFIPLQMTSTSFLWQPSFESTGAYGYNAQQESTGRNEPFFAAAAYSMLTTAGDYHLFLQALVSGQGLSDAAHTLLLSDMVAVVKPGKTATETTNHISWALGLGIQRNESGTAIWHWGDNGDFKSFFMAFPQKKQSIVYFANSQNGLRVMPAILNHYFGAQTWWALQWLNKDF